MFGTSVLIIYEHLFNVKWEIGVDFGVVAWGRFLLSDGWVLHHVQGFLYGQMTTASRDNRHDGNGATPATRFSTGNASGK